MFLQLFRPAFAGILVAALVAPLLAASGARAHEFKLGSLEIEHPWSRAIPSGAKVAGGYAVITNHGTQPDRLIAVTAAIAGRSEIHEMSEKDGVATMRMLRDGIPIPPGGTVALKPGSFHFMFMELKQAPKAGEPFAGTLTFEKAGTVAVTFAVEPIGASMPAHADHGAMPSQ